MYMNLSFVTFTFYFLCTSTAAYGPGNEKVIKRNLKFVTNAVPYLLLYVAIFSSDFADSYFTLKLKDYRMFCLLVN